MVVTGDLLEATSVKRLETARNREKRFETAGRARTDMSHFKKRAVLEDEDGEERSGKNEKKRRVNIAEVGCPPPHPPAAGASLVRLGGRRRTIVRRAR